MRRALEVKAGRSTPQAAAQSLTQALSESAAQAGGRGVSIGDRAKGLAKGVGVTFGAINRGNVAARQGAAQLLTSPQQVRGTPPANQTSVPDVKPPIDVQDLKMTRTINPKFVQQQQNIRQRAKENPYVAATLLGGLGSAGLL